MSLIEAVMAIAFGSRHRHVPDGFYEVRDRVRRLKLLSSHREEKIESRIESLEESLAAQALTFQALMSACLEQGLFTESEFLAAMRELDLEDGVADGKMPRAKETE